MALMCMLEDAGCLLKLWTGLLILHVCTYSLITVIITLTDDLIERSSSDFYAVVQTA